MKREGEVITEMATLNLENRSINTRIKQEEGKQSREAQREEKRREAIEKEKIYQKIYWEKNKDKAQKYQRIYRERNKKKLELNRKSPPFEQV